MIATIRFRIGNGGTGTPLAFDPPPVTVFVGPNNSGKSLVLRELARHMTEDQPPQDCKIIESVSFRGFTDQEIDAETERLQQTPIPGETVGEGLTIFGHGTFRTHLKRETFAQALRDPNTQRNYFVTNYFRSQTMGLDGQSRLILVNNASSRNLQQPPGSPLDILLRDNAKRASFRQLTYEAFGRYLTLDLTEPSTVKLKFADRVPTEEQERSFTIAAVDFHRTTQPIAEFSDGVKAFVGILLMVMAGEPRVLTIDEPEAFLHPSLAFALAREVCKALATSGRKLLVATHSPEFVMGCVSSGANVNVVRLTHTPVESTARLLPHDEMRSLMRKPMLRSAGALRGLFYQSVIVTEADADRAFYEEANERLLAFSPKWGSNNCLFLNANGKDTISELVSPLRALGIPAAAIVDLDIVEKGGTEWTKFMDACHVPAIERAALELSRSKIRAALHDVDPDYKRKRGVEVLANGDKEAAENFLGRLAEYGLFVVPCGEVEQWLADLPLNRGKATWLREVFQKLGDSPDQAAYVKPGTGDVWEFLGRVKVWLENGQRKGIRA